MTLGISTVHPTFPGVWWSSELLVAVWHVGLARAVYITIVFMKEPDRPAMGTSIPLRKLHTKNKKNYTHLQEPGEKLYNLADQRSTYQQARCQQSSSNIHQTPDLVCCSDLLACWSLMPMPPKAVHSPSSVPSGQYGTLRSGTSDWAQVWVKSKRCW